MANVGWVPYNTFKRVLTHPPCVEERALSSHPLSYVLPFCSVDASGGTRRELKGIDGWVWWCISVNESKLCAGREPSVGAFCCRVVSHTLLVWVKRIQHQILIASSANSPHRQTLNCMELTRGVDEATNKVSNIHRQASGVFPSESPNTALASPFPIVLEDHHQCMWFVHYAISTYPD